MSQNKAISYLRIVLTVTALVTIAACYQFTLQMIALGAQFSLKTRVWVIVSLVGASGLVELFLLLLTWTRMQNRFFVYLEIVWQAIKRYRLLAILSFGFFVGIFPYVLLGPIGEFFLSISPRLLIFVLSVLGAAVALKVLNPSRDVSLVLVAAALAVAMVYKIAIVSQNVSTYPFSLGWSEGSRYYYASLFFSKELYGQTLPLSALHPSRYMLLSVPFIISGLPIWFHRLWQVFLWIILPLLSGVTLAHRFSFEQRLKYWLFVAWAFLFLNQGPVYYHLNICLIVIFLGFDTKRFWRSLFVVILASCWAGISRVNWIPMPAFVAATIYFVEKPVYTQKNIWRYLVDPMVWIFFGVFTGLISQTLYIVFSGNNAATFGSSFTSNLLWYRLLPNATYSPGILPGILVISLPLLVAAFLHLRQYWQVWHPVRLSGLGVILMALLGGGLVVSVKIGGGSNLHNMDAFISLLMITVAFLFFGQFGPEVRDDLLSNKTGSLGFRVVRPWGWVLTSVVCVPVLVAIISGSPMKTYDPLKVANNLQKLESITEKVAQSGGDVLFISQRHLLLFNYLHNIPLVTDYEQIELMEMVMSGNRDYMDRFYSDIQNNKYSLIITDRLAQGLKDRDSAFSEENNVWVENVSKPILESYQELAFLKYVGVQVLEPKP